MVSIFARFKLGTLPPANADYWNWRTMADLLDNDVIDEPTNPLAGPGGSNPPLSAPWRVQKYVNV